MPGGRRKDPEERRGAKIVVMLTPAEKELLVAAAKASDAELSQWVRQVLLPVARKILAAD